ncbi:hypothetical protein SAMN05421736_11630 [Evansella caseinilytica]|uniref:Uncharacterized protein n=1 Tax=Evansella caseinilytica TaxID=1503961 RepID=A0A1H3TUQ2_9BACI|nr:hypothetical protein [Evansella caseinilytica]SDZ53435.1 hypothetical protein SAMN05421736_11630 [Evansella caseinilytica]
MSEADALFFSRLGVGFPEPGWRHSAVAHKCNLNVLRRVNLRRVTADAGRERFLGGIGRIERNHCLFEHTL